MQLLPELVLVSASDRIARYNNSLQDFAAQLDVPRDIRLQHSQEDDGFSYGLLAEVITFKSDTMDFFRRDLEINLLALSSSFVPNIGHRSRMEDTNTNLMASLADCLRAVHDRKSVQLMAITSALLASSRLEIGLPFVGYDTSIPICENNRLLAENFKRVFMLEGGISDVAADLLFVPENSLPSVQKLSNTLIRDLRLGHKKTLKLEPYDALLSQDQYGCLEVTISIWAKTTGLSMADRDTNVCMLVIYSLTDALSVEQGNAVQDKIRALHRWSNLASPPASQCLLRTVKAILADRLDADDIRYLQEAWTDSGFHRYLRDALLNAGFNEAVEHFPDREESSHDASVTESGTTDLWHAVPHFEQGCACPKCSTVSSDQGEWIHTAAEAICTKNQQEEQDYYRRAAYLSGIEAKLDNEILIWILEHSSSEIQQAFAINLALLNTYLFEDGSLISATSNAALQDFSGKLRTSTSAGMTREDDAQLRSILRALLQLSGCRIDVLSDTHCEEYAIGSNVALLASLNQRAPSEKDEQSRLHLVRQLMSSSPALGTLSGGLDSVEVKTKDVLESLWVGAVNSSDGLPKGAFYSLSVANYHYFRAYCAHMSILMSSPKIDENRILFLLVYSSNLPPSQIHLLQQWSESSEGQDLYAQWTKAMEEQGRADAPDHSQLCLHMAAVSIYCSWNSQATLFEKAKNLTESSDVSLTDAMAQSAEMMRSRNAETEEQIRQLYAMGGDHKSFAQALMLALDLEQA